MSDYISREALIKAVEGNPYVMDSVKSYVRCTARSIPAADVRPVVRAKWEDVHIDRPEIADLEVASMFCPHCNRWHNEVYQYGNPIEFANFCPNCGADMRQTGDENV